MVGSLIHRRLGPRAPDLGSGYEAAENAQVRPILLVQGPVHIEVHQPDGSPIAHEAVGRLVHKVEGEDVVQSS